jgi:hypothetical protein
MDLNTLINADDYFQIDSGYLMHIRNPTAPTSFRWGNVDHVGGVDADDYYLVENTYVGRFDRETLEVEQTHAGRNVDPQHEDAGDFRRDAAGRRK